MDWAVYGALIAATLLVLVAAVLVAIRAFQGWRTLKRARRHLARSLEQLAATADHTGEIVDRITDQSELEGTLAQLRVSLARFNVLRAAVDDVSGSLGRITAVYPRK